MARAKVHHVKCARKDNDVVKKGQEYWWWKFRYGGKQISTTDPGVSVMVRLTEYEEKLQEFQGYEELETSDELEEMKSSAEEFRDELQERLDNIPEALQESHVLTERIEEINGIIEEIENKISELEE